MSTTTLAETDAPRVERMARERALLAEAEAEREAAEARVPSEEEMEAWWDRLEAQGDAN